MSKNAVYGLVGLLIVGVVAWYASQGYTPPDQPLPQDEAAVRAAAADYATSSERVDVVSVEQIGEGMVYRVEANVIQLAADPAATALAVQPVTLTIEKQADTWVVTDVEKGSYSELPERKSVVGYWECLPKVGPGPHTMECAFGIALDQSLPTQAGGGHLAVNTQLMSTYPVDYAVGTKVRIEGVVTPAQALSSDQWRSYDIDGIISATAIQKVE